MKKYIWVVLIVAAFLFTACKHDKEVVTNETVTEKQTMEEPTETEPEYSEFKGITVYEKGQNTNDSGNISKIAEIVRNEWDESGCFQWMTLCGYSDGKIVIGYCMAVSGTYAEDNLSDGQAMDYEYHLALADKDTLVVYEDKRVSKGGDCYFKEADGIIWCITSDINNVRAVGYDMQLNKKGVLNIPDTNMGSFSENLPYYYYVKDGGIHCRSLDGSGNDIVIELSQAFFVELMGDVFVGRDSQEYATVTGLASDLKRYSGIVNLTTGEFFDLENGDDSGIAGESRNGILIINDFYDDGMKIAVNKYNYNPISFSIGNNYFFDRTDILGNDIVLSYYDEDCCHIGVYDIETGNLICSDYLSSQTNPIYMSYYSGPESPFQYTEEDEIMFISTDYDGNIGFFKWDISDHTLYGNMDMVKVTAEAVFEPVVASIENYWNPNYFIPEAISEDLEPLRERADALEKMYDVQICIGDECKRFVGGYAVMAINDYDTIAEALDCLEREMGKYPENFFSQLITESATEIDILISGEMYGVDSGSLEAAGGLKTYDGNKMLIIVDCTYPDNINLTLHHELSHAIDDKIIDMECLDQTEYLDDEYWKSINPEFEGRDIYTYSYEEFGWENSFYYTSDDHLYDEDMSMVYFVDSYSMTFPTEDRARIFENIMRDDCWIEWEKCTGLNTKKNYYIDCIKKVFDTTGWSEDFLETEN